MLPPRIQGDFGELSALYWLIGQGAHVSIPFGHSPHYGPAHVDHLFVLVGDGRQWFIPAGRVEGGTSINLGGPKYAEFEVEPGDPIPDALVSEAPLQSSLA